MSSLVITVGNTVQTLQLGTLSAAVTQQINQAVASTATSAETATAAATAAQQAAASVVQLYLGMFATGARPTPTQTGQFGIDTTNGFVVVTQLTPSIIWTNAAGVAV